MKQPKPKKCKCCKEIFVTNKSTQSTCSWQCAISLTNIAIQKKYDKEAKVQKAEMKERIKTLSDYKRELQVLVNHIARLIDQDCPCVSSGRSSGKMSGGHRWACGGWDNLRFNLMNIWIQSFHDNHHLSGNPSGYDKFLKEAGIYELVMDLNVTYPMMRWKDYDIKEKIVIARQIVKELKEMNQTDSLPRPNDLRISLRVKFNTRLGIYT